MNTHYPNLPEESLLTAEAVAEYLNISARQVRRLATLGELESVQIGRSVRFTPSGVRTLVERSLRPGKETPVAEAA